MAPTAEAYKKSPARDTFESLVVTVILAIFGTTFVLQAFKIPSGSMETTLLIGDHLLVNRFAFASQEGWLRHVLPYRTIQRGDLFIFKFPGPSEDQQEPGEHLVKRVIGVPGDRIRIVTRQVFVNGKALSEPYARHSLSVESRPGDNFPFNEQVNPNSAAEMQWSEEIQNYVENGELVVPPDHYFAMGDNREDSWDSRFWGFVPASLVSGRPMLIYWSYDTPPEEYLQNSIGDKISQLVDLVIHFPMKTRWKRAFRIVH